MRFCRSCDKVNVGELERQFMATSAYSITTFESRDALLVLGGLNFKPTQSDFAGTSLALLKTMRLLDWPTAWIAPSTFSG